MSMTEDQFDRYSQLLEYARIWGEALQKIKDCADSRSPIAVATLNQDECRQLIAGILDAYTRAFNS